MKNRAAKPGKKPTFGIIGFGRFGQLWTDCLKPFGDVKIFDKNSRKNIQCAPLKNVVSADMLFLLAPISEIENICKKIAPLLKRETVVIDACSVKVHPVKIMKKWLSKGQPVIATHPLFGPDSVKRFGLKNQKIVVFPVRSSKKQIQSFEKILKKLRLKIIHATPEQHDLQMAKSQALVHFLGRGLGPLNLSPQDIATPDYNTLLRMNDMVNNDTWQLFYDMQNFNPYTKKSAKLFSILYKNSAMASKKNIANPQAMDELGELRSIINALDEAIIRTIADRMIVSRTVGAVKKLYGLKISDPKREKELKALHKKLAAKHKITHKTLEKIFDLIMEESKRIQK